MANTLRLIFGNAGAQVINLLTIPIITRLYSPESYGLFVLFLSMATLIVPVSTLRFHSAILLPKKSEDATSILFICIFSAFIFAGMTGVIATILQITSLKLPGSFSGIEPYLWLMALYIFMAGSYRALNFMAVRVNDFSIQALSRVSNSFISKLFAVLYGIFFLSNPIGLIYGVIAGHTIACWLTVKKSLTKNQLNIKSVNIKVLKKNLINYKTFAIYSGSAFFDSLTKVIAPLLLSIYFGPAIIGYLGLTMRVFQQPLGVLGDSISRSFYQKITEAHRAGKNYDNYIFELFKYLLIITFIPVLLFSIISPEIFKLIFGAKWHIAGVYFSVLSISFLSNFLYRPFSIIFDVQEKQRLRFLLSFLRAAVSIVAICAGAYVFRSPLYTLICYSAANTIITFGIIFLLMHMSGVAYISLFSIVIKEILIGALLMTPVLYIKFYTSVNAMILLIAVILCIIFYVFYVFYNEPKLKMKLQLFIEGIKK